MAQTVRSSRSGLTIAVTRALHTLKGLRASVVNSATSAVRRLPSSASLVVGGAHTPMAPVPSSVTPAGASKTALGRVSMMVAAAKAALSSMSSAAAAASSGTATDDASVSVPAAAPMPAVPVPPSTASPSAVASVMPPLAASVTVAANAPAATSVPAIAVVSSDSGTDAELVARSASTAAAGQTADESSVAKVAKPVVAAAVAVANAPIVKTTVARASTVLKTAVKTISSPLQMVMVNPDGLKGATVNLGRIAQPFYVKNPSPSLEAEPDRDRMLVFLAKRPLESWEVLTHIGVEHVGVMVMRVSPALIECALSVGRFKLPRLSFDYLPLEGDTSKFGGRVPAKIQRNALRPVDWALVGFSSRTLDDIHEFNAQFDLTYHLGHNDCRDYASRLVAHLSGVNIAPGMISWFINSSPRRNQGYSEIVEMVANTLLRTPRPARLRSRLTASW